MGRVQVVLDDEIEALLRSRSPKKGDMSKNINEALRDWLNKESKKK